MNLKLENIFLFLVVLADFSRTVSSFYSKCPPLKLVNGRSRYGWRGRSVRFNCMRGFQLVGVKYVTCMNGKWDASVPICVKYGCRVPSTNHVNGQFIESYRGAVVKIVCNPGYALVGSPSVYCNGIRWNETFPVCRVKNTNPALSCDFESPDLCGWSQDPMHDFDWKRQNGSGSSGDSGTGPAFDHTKGENETGHYMFMERSSARMENDTTKLFSPVYPPEFSRGACFKFWYHMFGPSSGFLKVYVKPEGVELFNLIPSFWINGDQGKSWKETFFPIETMETPFQIVIEGIRGPGLVGDTAFDDVNLTSSDECKTLEEMTSSTEFSTSVNPDDDVIDVSCKNRCGQEQPKGTNVTGSEYERCNCYETCDRDGTCCSDYFEFCSVFASTQPTTTQTDTKMSSSISSSPSTVPSVEPEVKLPSTKPTPKHPLHNNNESNEIEAKRPADVAPPPKPPDRSQNEIPFEEPTTPRTTRRTTTPRTELKIEKNETKTEKQKTAKVLEKKVGKTGTNKTKAGNETAKEIPRQEVRPKVEEKPEVKSATVTSSVATTTSKVLKNSKPTVPDYQISKYQKTFVEKQTSTNLANDFRFNVKKQKEGAGKEPPQAVKIDKKEETKGGVVREVAELGGTALAIVVIVIFGIMWYKRRKNQKTERESMVEDSDVRFLTSDEALDFTLARPADDDL